jgi:hypothetical protein
LISPHIFEKKKQSRFKFAHSVDPTDNKSQKDIDDGDEIEVPKSIQDLIEKGIRTLSNSLSTQKNTIRSQLAGESNETWLGGLRI